MSWAVKFRSFNRTDGAHEYFVRHTPGDLYPALFKTRSEAREFAQENFGYISRRSDLRAKPYGWLVPQVVRVCVKIEEAMS